MKTNIIKMFDFDWSILENLPLTYRKFKENLSISSYDRYLNKFWFKSDYNEPRAIDFSDTLEIIEGIETMLLSEEATFDFTQNRCKVYRHIITTSEAVIATPFFNDKDELYNHTMTLLLPEIEKELAQDEFRRITAA